MGSVTLFIQNITSGRGYIAMAANNLGKSHPLGVLAASLFFGCCQALGNFLQNTSAEGPDHRIHPLRGDGIGADPLHREKARLAQEAHPRALGEK